MTKYIKVNFVHPSMEVKLFLNSTVGKQIVFYSRVISSTKNQVFINGRDYQLYKTAESFSPSTNHPGGAVRRVLNLAPWVRISLFWKIAKDAQMLAERMKIPESYFVSDANNIVFQGPRLKSSSFWENYVVTLLFDEPPSIGDNIGTICTRELLLRRLKVSIQRTERVWCYHQEAAIFVASMGARNISMLPCHMRSDEPAEIKSEGFYLNHSEIEVVVVSTFLPWHEILSFLEKFVRSEVGRLHLIGVGTTYDQCFDQFGNHDLVVFHGYKNQVEISEILRTCHVGVVPAIPWFNAPLKIIDYGFAGLACVSVHSRGVASYYDGNEVLLAQNQEQVINILLELRDNREMLFFHAKCLNMKMHNEFTSKRYSQALLAMVNQQQSDD